MERNPIDWNKLESPRRVWLSDGGHHSKARFEFLAGQGLRLIMVDFEGDGRGTLHFSDPRDRETIHIKTGRGEQLLLIALKYFPEASRWLALLGLADVGDLKALEGQGFLERADLFLTSRGGRVREIHEMARAWPRVAALGKRPAQALPVIEGDASQGGMARTISFIEALEEARGIRAAEAGMAFRTVLLELENIRCHLAWIGDACKLMGRPKLTSRCWALASGLDGACETWLGEAKGRGWCVPGGVREDFPAGGSEIMLQTLIIGSMEWNTLERNILSLHIPRWLERRLSFLPPMARAEGWVGPLARAAGRNLDSREEEAGIYEMMGWSSLGSNTKRGTFGRVLEIKAREISSSMEMMLELLADLPGGPVLRHRGRGGKGEGFGRAEGPEGEVCCHLRLEKGLLKYIVFSLPTELNRSAARCLSGAWLDEMEIASLLWESA